VVPVRQVAGEPVHQVVVGSSANPGLRDFAVVAETLRGRQVHPQVSLEINPTSRQILADLTKSGAITALVEAGARIHQTGCLGCIGMGQAPAVGRNSLRTFPRNFPGRSGTHDDAVWLCSPETAAAAALTGAITDPRDLGLDHPEVRRPRAVSVITGPLQRPLPIAESRQAELVKAPSIGSLPELDPLPDSLTLPILLKVGDDVSTDEIMPAGARALPYRSDIAALADFAFGQIDETYPERARAAGWHAVVGGRNYGQGSSREHAAIVPRHLGLRVVIAKSFARIHWQNLADFGVLALEFAGEGGYDRLCQGDELRLEGLREAVETGSEITAGGVVLRHRLSPRQRAMVLAGGWIPLVRGAAGNAQPAR
jgi:aconitate hydratase